MTLRGKGVYSTPAIGAEVTIRVKAGSTVLASTVTTALVSNATDYAFSFEVALTCYTSGVSGTLMTGGNINYRSSGGLRVFDDLNNDGAAVTVDTTAGHLLDVTIQWDGATASRSAKITTIDVNTATLS